MVFGFAPITTLESDQGQEKSRSRSHFKRKRLWLSRYNNNKNNYYTPFAFFLLLDGIFGSDESLEASTYRRRRSTWSRSISREAELRSCQKSLKTTSY